MVTGRTVDVLVQSLKVTSPSIVPVWLTGLFQIVLLPVTALGSIAALIGLIAWALWAYEMWNRFPVLYSLGSWRNPVCMVLGFVLGFGLRLAALARFEVEHDQPREFASTQLIGTSGLFALLLIWALALVPLFEGWVLIAVSAGWWQAKRFTKGMQFRSTR